MVDLPLPSQPKSVLGIPIAVTACGIKIPRDKRPTQFYHSNVSDMMEGKVEITYGNSGSVVEKFFVADLLGESFAFFRTIDGVDIDEVVVILQVFYGHFFDVLQSLLALVLVHVLVVDKVLRFSCFDQELQELLVLGALLVQEFDLVVERVVFGV